ncbi:hypothetical protein NQ318_016891 [Aromia moschata]|uniref:C2H2-type domain-containing protein n=1 Tax=Aromia moschata TaxID=1265417 RepID=A0AAV8XQX4_9CUCU|nr:hypothetical protein NQ318_016891 [Aromia moschata]
MANKTAKKGKKPLQTTLGKAPTQAEKEVDLSHVQKPIHTSIFGLRQVLSLFETATEEVQNYITYECDIMYECRSCRTIFRSLANFILHKRNYCHERYSHVNILINNETSQDNTCLESPPDKTHISSRPHTPEQQESVSKDVRKDLRPIIQKLKERQEIQQMAQEALNEDLSTVDLANNPDKGQDKSSNNDILLEKIATNNAAVFQTMLQNMPTQQPHTKEYMKSEVMEIHGILGSDEAVLGPDGKICTFETNKVNANPVIPRGELVCSECDLKFSTKKTLTYHIKYKHNNTRLVYICPDCKDSFANAWCVYRHLYKIHRRTSAQIKRMREQIHNSRVRKDQEPAKKKDKKVPDKVDKTDDENQWLNNIEGDNDFQMCGGCGKRFERKAALHSHAQMCIKRIAVCNTIKENNAKKKEEESKENRSKIPKLEKSGPSEAPKGSSKRKPYLLRTYRSSDKSLTDTDRVVPPQEICDVNANCEKLKSYCDSEKNDEKSKTSRTPVISSSETNVSPAKSKNGCPSPSVEGIDTEKMLNIIGVSSISNNTITKNEDVDKSGFEGFAVEENKSHTASDFDLFCQSIADQLSANIPEEAEDTFNKTGRTIPLILRKHSIKSEKRKTILDPINADSLPENEKLSSVETEDKKLQNNVVENGIKESQGSKNLPPTSPFRITVKSLEELTGVSSANQTKCSKLRNDIESTNAEVSDTIRANISPDKLQRRVPKALKRKRTASLDHILNDPLKLDEDPLSSKKDVSFLSKAAPYMDQNKLLCVPCQLSYTNLSKLLWHMSAHFSWFRFQCSRCSFISFNKFDCASHARRSHNVKKRSMQSVVLPIPNWKTVLMSHDFCQLKDDNDLSGKHTDEIILSGNEEDLSMESAAKNELEEGPDWCDDLFVDSRVVEVEPDDSCDFSLTRSSIQRGINDCIDIVDDVKDSFQIEVPQEIYTLDITEIINSVEDREEERHSGLNIKCEQVENDEDLGEGYYALEENDFKTAEVIKAHVKSEDEELDVDANDEGPSAVKTKAKKNSDCIVNVRPTRNRIRSIKTIQDDFFYDLSKVIKLNDSSVSKPAMQKSKKASAAIQKSSKETSSSSSKNETKSLRVYSSGDKGIQLFFNGYLLLVEPACVL